MLQVFKLVLFYGSFLLFPLAWYALYFFITKRTLWMRFRSLFLFVIFVLGIWGRFIEPSVIVTHHTQIAVGFRANIALVSDFHLGMFQGRAHMDKIVEQLQKIEVDAIMIAGDFTYWPDRDDIPYLFAPLAELDVPVYAVLGNHDVEKPGDFLKDILVPTLEQYNVVVLENEAVALSNYTLVGLGSHMNNNDDVSILQNYTYEDNIVVLAHNPDTTLLFEDNTVDLTLAGHTHGGQVRLPRIYRYVIPTTGSFDRGLTQENTTQLFVSAGLGMTGLPMRLFNPPVIDVLYLR